MQFKRARRLLSKQVRRQQQQVETLGRTAEKGMERNFFRRFGRLRPVRRFVIGWVSLMVLLIGCSVAQFEHLSAYYQKTQPVAGGIYTEGMIGSISNVNPIYATNEVDRSLSRLLFNGLFEYNSDNQLVGSLARAYDVSDNGKVYTVHLKPGLSWHDGQRLTSADVLFTYNTIKDPDARSPLLNSWQNVKVTATDTYTVVFTLPSPLASFPYNLTTGIVPQHILGKISGANMRSTDFNTVSPIGSGPFMWHGLQLNGNDPSDIEEQVALLPFDDYVDGRPKLDEFIVRSYRTPARLQQAYASGQLTAAAGLDTLPTDGPKSSQTHDLSLTAGTYVFFKTSSGVLADTQVRQALVAASQPNDIIRQLGYAARPVTEPLLTGQLAFNKAYAQKTNDKTAAASSLTQAGWIMGANGIRSKDGKPLAFGLVATDTPEYRQVTRQLVAQWRAVGVEVKPQLVSAADYANILSGHEYDATIYGISIGQDPDVYAYWDGTQADIRSANRLNLSEWNNATANSALQAGRTRSDPQLRTVKYAPFLQAWQQESPALGLYQPRYLYVTRGSLYGLTDHAITNSINRYNGVEHWQIRTARVTQ